MRNERGSATLVMVTLVLALGVVVIVNGNEILRLASELRRIDHKQQQRFEQSHGQDSRH